ncbi:MAG: hypothetical protein U0Q15_06215 [Kineosporiaceae bacterium]
MTTTIRRRLGTAAGGVATAGLALALIAPSSGSATGAPVPTATTTVGTPTPSATADCSGPAPVQVAVTSATSAQLLPLHRQGCPLPASVTVRLFATQEDAAAATSPVATLTGPVGRPLAVKAPAGGGGYWYLVDASTTAKHLAFIPDFGGCRLGPVRPISISSSTLKLTRDGDGRCRQPLRSTVVRLFATEEDAKDRTSAVRTVTLVETRPGQVKKLRPDTTYWYETGDGRVASFVTLPKGAKG